MGGGGSKKDAPAPDKTDAAEAVVPATPPAAPEHIAVADETTAVDAATTAGKGSPRGGGGLTLDLDSPRRTDAAESPQVRNRLPRVNAVPRPSSSSSEP